MCRREKTDYQKRQERAKLKAKAKEEKAKAKARAARPPLHLRFFGWLKTTLGVDDPLKNAFHQTVGIERANSFTECRQCLEPGIERGCCGAFYCNQCYYRFEFCPSCDTKIDISDAGQLLPEPSQLAKVAAFCFVLVATLFVCSALPFAIWWEANIPRTVFGYQCSGLFPPYDRQWLCLSREYAMDRANATRTDQWPRCISEESEDGCICWHACTVNLCTFDQSGGTLGVDWELDGFYPAEIVMHEHFLNNTINPAYWTATGGQVMSKTCGVVRGEVAMRFRGPSARFAETVDFPVPYGGEVEFHLAYGRGQVGCASMENGWASFAYSTDRGANWFDIETYPRNVYKVENFTKVRHVLPANASSPATRFKWYQKDYWADFDVFAIDEIKVFANLSPQWNMTAPFMMKKAELGERERLDECCLGCNLCPRPHQIEDVDSCSMTPGYAGEPQHVAMEHEMILFFTCLIAVVLVGLEVWHVVNRLLLAGVLQCLKPCLEKPDDDGESVGRKSRASRSVKSASVPARSVTVGATSVAPIGTDAADLLHLQERLDDVKTVNYEGALTDGGHVSTGVSVYEPHERAAAAERGEAWSEAMRGGMTPSVYHEAGEEEAQESSAAASEDAVSAAPSRVSRASRAQRRRAQRQAAGLKRSRKAGRRGSHQSAATTISAKTRTSRRSGAQSVRSRQTGLGTASRAGSVAPVVLDEAALAALDAEGRASYYAGQSIAADEDDLDIEKLEDDEEELTEEQKQFLAQKEAAKLAQAQDDSSSSSESASSEEEEVAQAADVKTVKMKFSSRKGTVWLPVFLVLGVAAPAVLSVVLLGFLTQYTGDDIVLNLGVMEYHTLYGFITTAALITDAAAVLRLAGYVVGVLPMTQLQYVLTKPKLTKSDDLLMNVRQRVLTVHRGAVRDPIRIKLNNIRRVDTPDRDTLFALAASHILTAQPLALIGLALPESHRWIAIAFALTAMLRLLWGESFLFKVWLVVWEALSVLYSRDKEKRERFAASCCGYRCRLAGWLGGWVFGGALLAGFAGYVFLVSVSPRAAHLLPYFELMIGVGSAGCIVLGVGLGFVLGCTHTLPVHPVVGLTSLSGGVVLYFSHPRASELFERRRICTGNPNKIPGTGYCVPLRDLCSGLIGIKNPHHTHFALDPSPFQEAQLIIFVKNPRKFMGEVDMDTIVHNIRARQNLERAAADAGIDLSSASDEDADSYDDQSEEALEEAIEDAQEQQMEDARRRARAMLVKEALKREPLAVGSESKAKPGGALRTVDSKVTIRDEKSMVALREQLYAAPGIEWKDTADDEDRYVRWLAAQELVARKIKPLPQAWYPTPHSLRAAEALESAKRAALEAAMKEHADKEAAKPIPQIGEKRNREPFIRGMPGAGPLLPGQTAPPHARHINRRRNAVMF